MKIIARSSLIIFVIALLLSLLFHLSGLLQLAYFTFKAAQEYKNTKFLHATQPQQKETYILFQEPESEDIPLPKRTRGVPQGQLDFETYKTIATAAQPEPVQPVQVQPEQKSEQTEKVTQENKIPKAELPQTKQKEQELPEKLLPEPELSKKETPEQKHAEQKPETTPPTKSVFIQHIPKHRSVDTKEHTKQRTKPTQKPTEQLDPNQLIKKLVKPQQQKQVSPKNLGQGFTPSTLASAVQQSMLQKGDDIFTLQSNIEGATSEEQMQLLTYVRRMVQQIEGMYRFIAPTKRMSPERLNCHLKTEIDRNGKLINIHLKKSSGIRDFDEHAIRGIKEAAPFSPLPKFYKKETLKQNWNVFG